MRNFFEKISTITAGTSGWNREELIKLMADQDVFSYVMDAEDSGKMLIPDETPSKFFVSRETAREVARLLKSLGVFDYKIGIGYIYSGKSSLSVIYNGEPI